MSSMFTVKLPFNNETVLRLKNVPGKIWDSANKQWIIANSSFSLFIKAIEKNHPTLAKRMLESPRFENVKQANERAKARYKLSFASKSDIEVPAPEGEKYLPYQLAGIEYALTCEADGVLFGDEMGLGKAQPLSTKVLTPCGWKKIGSLTVGDYVIGSNGKKTKVVGIFPQGLKEVFKVELDDGYATECCDEHLWAVNTTTRRGRGNPNLILPLKKIRQRLHFENGNRVHFIPIVEPVEFEPIEPLKMHPYCMGALLGDGGFSTGHPRFSNPEKEIISAIKQTLPAGSVLRDTGNNLDYNINSVNGKGTRGSNSTKNILEYYKLLWKTSKQKHIPKQYKRASIEDRLLLLQGLMDTDGYAMGTTACYCTSSIQLAKDFAELVMSLGGTVKRTSKIPKIYGKEYDRSYGFTIRLPHHFKPFLNSVHKRETFKGHSKYIPSRSIEKVDYIGEKNCVCIKVEARDHLYVTENFIVTHNTVQSLGVINCKPEWKSGLVFCPKSLIGVWRTHIKKWLIKPYKVVVCDTKTTNVIFDKNDIFIMNYDIIPKLIKKLECYKWDFIICDESFMLKNQKAKRTKAVKELSYQNTFIMELNGTPIDNRPEEFFSQLNLIDRNVWSSYFAFGNRYCGGFHSGCRGASNLDELQYNVRSTVMVRRMKADVLKDLPPKRRTIVEFDKAGYSGLLKREKNYQAVFDRLMKHNKDFENREYEKQVEKLKGGIIGDLGTIAKVRHESALEKIPDVIDFCEELLETKQKLVLFAYHRDVVMSFHEHFGNYSTYLIGGMKPDEVDYRVRTFQNSKRLRVFIGSIKASGRGFTLTAANTVVFAELDWSPGSISQCEDRTHRIGQTADVDVFHTVVENSIDCYIAKMLIDKQKVIDKAINRKPGR